MRGQTSCNRYSVGPPAAGPPATQSPATQSPAAQPSRQQVGRQQWEELVRAGLPSRSPTVHFFNGWMLSQMACSIWSVCHPCSENSVMSLCCRNKAYGFTEEQKQRNTENTKIQNSLKNKNKKYGKYGRTEFRKFLVMRHLYSHSLAMLAHACVQNDYFLFQSS